ncbi:ribosome maturation factor RimM [Bacteroidia bacterium]|nr:ribosome maturation factor RimM [Bacteroidia bacterium]GHV20450.1 ribosome maturation factor RimM [Bacteroidia bacterium]
MIIREDLIKIGRFNKPHGIKGELSFTFTDDSFDENECSFLICELDGILVPFRMEEYRFKSDSAVFVKLKSIDTDEKAKMLSNTEVYFPKQYMKSGSAGDSYTWDYFIGFLLRDINNTAVGRIVDVDEATVNVLFIVEHESGELLIPASEEIIMEIDEKQKIIRMDLPEGLLEL